ncbi:MAG: hypothetical protein IJ697_06250 [Synergistaceae bacterium]|nr:hypothetical protein [Synergistaceae bacterium]
MFKRLLIFAVLLGFSCCSYGADFVPEQKIIPVSSLKSGMTGYFLTVLKGTEPSKVPVKIISVIPQIPNHNVKDLVLVKLTGGVKLAQGMSGSPVFIEGKLAGAIRSGWENSDQTLALMIPIETMCSLSRYETGRNSPALTDVSISGLSANTPALSELSRKLGVNITQGAGINSGGAVANPETPQKFRPGDAIGVLLVWGDVELSAVGTVTATAKNGGFLAMGHDFLKRGAVNYPSAGVYVHDLVNSSSFPFKIASITGINGTVTQDRETGLLGRTGYYAPSVSGEFVFRDLDRNTENKCRFRTVADEFLTDELVSAVCTALAEELWGRKGQGTMSVTLRIDGKNLPNGWTRKDIFFSEDNIIPEAFKQVKTIINAYLTQPFNDVFPSGFRITIEATQNPKVLMIEEVETVEEAKPGDEIEVSVKMRGWRSETVTEKFKMKIPEDADGVIELIVRGGGTQSFGQAGIEGGWKSIGSLERLMTEFRAADSNNQLIAELNADKTGGLLGEILRKKKSGAKSKQSKESDLLPEEEEYLSETKERRIKEGTLKVYSTEYVVDGLMRRIIHTEK